MNTPQITADGCNACKSNQMLVEMLPERGDRVYENWATGHVFGFEISEDLREKSAKICGQK